MVVVVLQFLGNGALNSPGLPSPAASAPCRKKMVYAPMFYRFLEVPDTSVAHPGKFDDAVIRNTGGYKYQVYNPFSQYLAHKHLQELDNGFCD
jgi:hypothetical protein